MELRAQGLADRGRERRTLLRDLGEGVAQAVAEACPREQRTHTAGRALEAIDEAPSDPL